MKRIELKAKFCENSTVTLAEFEQILAGAGDWPGALISAGVGAPVDHWLGVHG